MQRNCFNNCVYVFHNVTFRPGLWMEHRYPAFVDCSCQLFYKQLDFIAVVAAIRHFPNKFFDLSLHLRIGSYLSVYRVYFSLYKQQALEISIYIFMCRISYSADMRFYIPDNLTGFRCNIKAGRFNSGLLFSLEPFINITV